MIVYLDTSVVLRVFLGESNPTDLWEKWDEAYSSSSLAIRSSANSRSSSLNSRHHRHGSRRLGLEIYPLNDRILQRASETFPTVVGTLDAIHLASAIFIREVQPIDFLMTHDSQLGTTARSLGFQIAGTN